MGHTGTGSTMLRAPRAAWITSRALAFAAALAASLVQAGPIELKVMTRNVYVGIDLAPIFQATPATLPFVVTNAINAAGATKAEERMQRIAQEIFDAKPHIVGLQEASLWASQFPSDFVPGAPPNAANPLFGGRFIEQITKRLEFLGLPYSVYGVAKNSDNELPGVSFPGPVVTDYRLTDFDAILVRNDVTVLNEGTQTFGTMLTVPVAGLPVPLPRSYGFVDVEISGITVRAFNTHLEALAAPVSEGQALELLAAANTSPYRHVLLGDFNTITDGGVPTSTDEFILAAGFSDAWLDKGAGPGFTWGFDADLNDPLSELTERLDYVFHRGGFNTLDVEVIGTETGLGQPLWPSDHAGVVALLQVIPEPGTIVLMLIALGALTVTRQRVTLPGLRKL